MERGDKVRLVKAKLKSDVGRVGVLVDMDRGNVFVQFEPRRVITTRMSSLEPVSVVDEIAKLGQESEP